jgi:hypothetical protein
VELTGAANIVRLHGIEKAREMATTAHERRLMEIAHEVLADERQSIGIGYSGMCLTSLPYRRLPDDRAWEKHGHNVTLLIEPGRLMMRGQWVLYGVPWGSRGRILLIHLMTQAVRTNSREVVLGKSARQALERMGLSYSGETASAIRDQGARLSACNLKWAWSTNGGDRNHKASIIKSSFHLHDEDERQQSLFADAVMLDEEFFKELQAHPVPFAEEAIRQLSHSPMAIDAYTWLSYRLHYLERPQDVSWPALATQFGPSYKAIRQFRHDFILTLDEALAAYPDAKVEMTATGVRLHPSPPAVPKITKLPAHARKLVAQGG